MLSLKIAAVSGSLQSLAPSVDREINEIRSEWWESKCGNVIYIFPAFSTFKGFLKF